MKNIFFLVFLGLFLTAFCFAQTATTVEITDIAVNDGIVYVNIFSTPDSFKNDRPYRTLQFEASNSIVSQELSIPSGEYVITAYQDANDNQRLDSNVFGVPRELVGMSNYFGRGYPSKNFDRQKIAITNSAGKVTIGIYRF